MSAKNLKVQPKEKSRVEIEWEIPADVFAGYEKLALKNLGQEVKIDGFRSGHIPENILKKHVGDSAILMEMAELAIRDSYPKIVVDEKIEAIGRPEITITKIALGNNLGIKATTAVMPKVELGDYETAARKVRDQKEEPIAVTDEELDKVLEEIQKSRTKEGNSPAGEAPELNGQLAKTFGDFKKLEEVKQKIRDNLKHEKERRARDKKRAALIDAVNETTKVEIPDVLTDYEIDKMLAELKAEIEQMGLTLDKYLEHIKKTEADLRTAWHTDAEKRVKTGLVLAAIAAKEKITIDTEKVKKETDHLLSHHPDAERGRAESYVENLLQNDAVMYFLETGEKKS